MSNVFTKLFHTQVKPMYFTLLGILFFVLIILYMYFLSMSVVHVVLRKETVHGGSQRTIGYDRFHECQGS